jgi:hypothetical protein
MIAARRAPFGWHEDQCSSVPTEAPLVVPPARQESGIRVMTSLIQQTGGTIAFDWRKAGLCCNHDF